MVHINMQTVPNHHHFAHHFWEKETVPSKLPYLHVEVMSRQRSPSGPHHSSKLDVLENQQGKMSSIRETQHTGRNKHIQVEEKNEYVPSWRTADKLFPLKPVLHKRAYSLSNATKADCYSCLPTLTDQAAVRHQQKAVRKLDTLNQHLTGRKKSGSEHHEQKISEKQTWLWKDIHTKEMMLQEKIYKAEETVRRVQKERNKSYFEKQKEDRFYWDGGWNRYGNERDDMERWEQWEWKTNGAEKSREGAKWDTRGRPLTSEVTKGHKLEKKELDEYEDQDWERGYGRRERGVGLDNHVRRRGEADRDYEDLCDVRKPNSSESMRDRSQLKHVRGEDALYKLTSKLLSMRSAERDRSQRGNRLQHVELEHIPDAPNHLIPCKVCHRCFAQERLETHMRVCEKKQPQRKVFDMSQHRAKGTELEEFMKTNRRSKTPERKKSTWRQKHEAFIQTMRQGRSHTSGREQPQSVSNLNSEYVACPHCGRRFAPGPAERHVPKCQNIKSRPPPPKQTHSNTRRRIPH